MAVVTISRQFGSGGNEIASHLCDLLGYRYFDKNLMAEVAHEVGLTPQEIVDFSEEQHEAQSFLDRLLRRPRMVAQTRVWKEDTAGTRAVETMTIDEKQSIALVQSTIRAAYGQGDFVIVGRGGQAVLQDRPSVLHVRIEAPLSIRIQRVQERDNLTPEGARALVTQRDADAADYVRTFYDQDWEDPLLYHMVINTGKWGMEAAAQVIAAAVQHLPFAA